MKVAPGRNLGKGQAFPGSGRVACACGDQASNRRTAARGSSWRARVMSDRAFALGLGSTGLNAPIRVAEGASELARELHPALSP